MASEQIQGLLSDLPFAMRNAIEGYVDAVDAVLEEIARDANVDLTSDIREQFLFIVAVRRIWTIVNGQYWILRTSANIAQERDIDGFQLGHERIGRDSAVNRRVTELRTSLHALLRRLEIEDEASAPNLSDVLVRVAARR
jgi:hypothetical protein